MIDFDRSEKDHSSRFRVRGVFTQPGSKAAVQGRPVLGRYIRSTPVSRPDASMLRTLFLLFAGRCPCTRPLASILHAVTVHAPDIVQPSDHAKADHLLDGLLARVSAIIS